MFAPSLGSQHMRCQGTLPADREVLPAVPPPGGLLLHQQRQDRLQLRARQGDLGRVEHQGPLAEPRARTSRSSPSSTSSPATRARSAWQRPPTASEQPTSLPRSGTTRPGRRCPPYHPDTPEVRQDWARYADMITFMDKQAGDILRQLDADGLADDTIVFFFSDHGAGMPRSKRWLYESSTRVPLIVRFPERYAGAGTRARPAPRPTGSSASSISAPTVLSLTGVTIPAHMQGTPFLGAKAGMPRRYVYGFRDRMDGATT